LLSFLKKNAIGNGLTKAFSVQMQNIDNLPDVKDKSVVIIDERIDWFSRLWYLRRYETYYNLPYIYMRELDQLGKKNGFSGTDIEFLKYSGAKDFWIVISANPDIVNLQDKPGYADYTKFVEATTQYLEGLGMDPTVINDYADKPAFLIYHFNVVL